MKSNFLIPELLVSHFEQSINFYTKILGFKIDYERPEKKFVMLSLQNNQIMLNERNGTWETGVMEYPFGRGVNFQIKIDNLESVIRSLKANNITLYQQPEENWYRKMDKEVGHRELLVQDPDGYLLRFAQDLGERVVKKR